MTNDELTGERPQYPIESVDNALRVLLLVASRPSVRLTEVSEHLGVATSTAHRLLAMLQYRGFIRQPEGARVYVHGPALTAMAFSVLEQVDLRAQLHPVLTQLSEDLGETVHLSRLSRDLVEFVDVVESPRAVRVGSRLGGTMPAHVSASGKALLSTLADRELMALYPDEVLPAVTGRSITRRAALVTQLDRIRKQGFATAEGESQDDVASVAVCLGIHGPSRWAMSVSAPVSRMTPPTRRRMTEELLAAAGTAAVYFERPRP